MTNYVTIDSQTIELTHPDKVLFPEDGITRQELADYFLGVAGYMLPHVRDRPMTLERFPEGIAEKGFFQKEVAPYLPGWVETVTFPLRGEDREQRQLLCNSAATLVYLASQDSITQHVWLSRADRLECPDRLIFDLDPPGEDFDVARFAANTIRAKLRSLGLEAFVMTTGSRGLHVVVPLDRSTTFDEARAWARTFAEKLAWSVPDSFTTELSVEGRKGRLFLDYLRNSYGQTGVAPYSVRAKKGAPVAMPISWDELEDLKSAQAYNIRNVLNHLKDMGDPWRDIDRYARPLKPFPEKK